MVLGHQRGKNVSPRRDSTQGLLAGPLGWLGWPGWLGWLLAGLFGAVLAGLGWASWASYWAGWTDWAGWVCWAGLVLGLELLDSGLGWACWAALAWLDWPAGLVGFASLAGARLG